jgi:hypothetical protein
MKQLTLSICIAVFTFILSTTATWGYYRIIESVPINEGSHYPSTATNKLSDDLEIGVLGFTETEYGIYAEVQVFNGSAETVYYWGYSKNCHCADLVRHEGKIKNGSNCWCGTGLR